MAEVLGLVGSAASLTCFITQLRSFYKFCHDLRDIPEDVQSIVKEIAMLRSTLTALNLHSQQLESQGFDVKEFRLVSLETSTLLTKVERKLDSYTAETTAGRKFKLGKRIRALLGKTKIEQLMTVLERMKATSTAAKRNLDSLVSQKEHADIQASINNLRNDLGTDLKPDLLDIKRQIHQTAIDLKFSTLKLGEFMPQKVDIQEQKQRRKTITTKSSEVVPGRRRHLSKPPCIYTHVLEGLAQNPFHLLVTCIFFNTKSQAAISQAHLMLHQFSEPEKLARAEYDEIQPFLANLGLFQRANWLISLARTWLKAPPRANILHAKRGRNPVFTSEVAHLQGIGVFANDAWRIFCKDNMYKQAGYSITIPEWQKVLPKNEGLTAYLRDRWDKEGYIWYARTGHLQQRDTGTMVKETVASADPAASCLCELEDPERSLGA